MKENDCLNEGNDMLFFFDVDGTLLYHKDWCVPASAACALRQLHERGHLIYLNTSRSPN